MHRLAFLACLPLLAACAPDPVHFGAPSAASSSSRASSSSSTTSGGKGTGGASASSGVGCPPGTHLAPNEPTCLPDGTGGAGGQGGAALDATAAAGGMGGAAASSTATAASSSSSGAACTPQGAPCVIGAPSCCSGLTCVGSDSQAWCLASTSSSSSSSSGTACSPIGDHCDPTAPTCCSGFVCTWPSYTCVTCAAQSSFCDNDAQCCAGLKCGNSGCEALQTYCADCIQQIDGGPAAGTWVCADLPSCADCPNVNGVQYNGGIVECVM